MFDDASHRSEFERQGYTVFTNQFRPALFFNPLWRDLCAILDAFVEAEGSMGLSVEHYRELGFGARLLQLVKAAGASVGQIFDCGLTPGEEAPVELHPNLGRGIFELLMSPVILDVVSVLLGQDVDISPVQHLRIKLPQYVIDEDFQDRYGRTLWHQDRAVFNPDADDARVVTVWLPLTAAGSGQGCLRVLPGSHREALYPHTENDFIASERIDDSRSMELPMKPGSILVFDANLVHGSSVNIAALPRLSLDFRYQEAGSPSIRPELPMFPARRSSDAVTVPYEEWRNAWLRGYARVRERPVSPRAR